jgi:hypothetical protein
LKISLDFDDTYTRDPAFWNNFILDAVAGNHDIRIVTFRSATGDNSDIVAAIGTLIPVLYTGGVWKKKYCYEQGFIPNIWIDDMPEIIVDPDAFNVPYQLVAQAIEKH